MPQTAALPPRGTALVLALVAALLLLRLGDVPLLGPDEPRYVRVAVEMSRTGDLVTPTLQGRPWLEKPVLYYWLAAAAFGIFGETETAARLPAVAAALVLAGATGFVGARLFGGPAGLHAAVVAGTSLLTFAYGRAASMDMLLAAAVTLAVGLAGLRVLGIAGRFALPAAGACIGLATLAKGPLGIAFPLLVIATFAVLRKSPAVLRRAWSPAALVLVLLVAAPWYLLVWRAQGWTFVETFLLNHNLQRFTSTIHRHPGPPYYYLPVLIAGLFPWSGLLFPALATLRPRASAADAFVLAWLVGPLAFFSLAGSKLPGYILPCVPPLALAVGRLADDWVRGSRGPGIGGRVAALLGLALCALVGTSPALAARAGVPGASLLVPVAVWTLFLGLAFSRRLSADPEGALRILRVGAAGFLVLLTTAAPPILADRESGRSLFVSTGGREVLAWGAWRTAWMAGYFYNDGNVREASAAEVLAAARSHPVLVLAGPSERRVLERERTLAVTPLALGPRGNALLRVEPATSSSASERPSPPARGTSSPPRP